MTIKAISSKSLPLSNKDEMKFISGKYELITSETGGFFGAFENTTWPRVRFRGKSAGLLCVTKQAVGAAFLPQTEP